MTAFYQAPCRKPSSVARQAALLRQASLTKPPGSLGALENLAVTLAALQSNENPAVDNVEICIFAGDHGVVEEGVSAFPQAVTGQMVHNFIAGGAAISVLAREAGAELTVVDAGTLHHDSYGAPVIERPVAKGTANFARQAAMSKEQCESALQLGADIIDGYSPTPQLVIGGEMGIGNTTSATALGAALSNVSVADLVGPGTGLDDAGVTHKQAVIEKALAQRGGTLTAIDWLCEVGGFEIAALAGFYIRAAQIGIPVLVDGFITSVAALAAHRLNSGVRDWLLFSHTSAEPGHQHILTILKAQPLLDLGMRLGEGSGSAVSIGLLRSACSLHNEMATFDQAGVSNKD